MSFADHSHRETLPSLGALRDQWRALQESSANVFSSWDWADVWWRHFGTGEPAVIALHEGGRARVIVPLYRSRVGGLRVARFIGHGAADQLGPVCEPAKLDAAIAALRGHQYDGELLLAERMAGGRDWASAVGGALLRREPSPSIDLQGEGDWQSYLGVRSSNFRQQARRRERRLQRGLGVRYRLTSSADELRHDFNALLALHDARWQDDAGTFLGSAAFHREFATRALERGWLRLWLAEVDGAPVAAWYGFRFGGVESYYQAGRDPAWERHSIGAGILEHSIREAFADGMREYRLLRGGEEYKRRYQTRDATVSTVAAASGALGRIVVIGTQALATTPLGRRLLRPLGP